MLVAVIVIVRVFVGDVAARAKEHPDRQRENQNSRDDLKIWLDGFRVPMAAEFQRERGKRPDDERVRKCGAKTEKHGLFDRSAHGDDEGGHHRLGMPRLKAVERAEQHGGRNENPSACRAVLDEFADVLHELSKSY